MGGIRRSYVDGPYGQIHVRTSGVEGSNGIPLYCAHQSPKNGSEFDAFMSAQAIDRLVVAPDYPGYGMSDGPPTELDATIRMYAESLWRVADELGHTKIDLFGNHTGSKVVAEMAVQAPERVGSIVMVSAAVLTDAERALFSELFRPIPLDEDGTRFATMWQRIVKGRGPGATLEMLSKSFLMNLMGGEAYEWGHSAAFAHGAPYENALRTLPHRITILNPRDDLSEATRRASCMMRNGVIVECPDWGYNFMDVFPEETARLVLSRL